MFGGGPGVICRCRVAVEIGRDGFLTGCDGRIISGGDEGWREAGTVGKEEGLEETLKVGGVNGIESNASS